MRPVVSAAAARFRYPVAERTVGPFSLAAHAGELQVLTGPSGCGKSTLARMLAGMIPHLYRGRFDGEVHVGEHGSRELPLWRISAHVGLVAQNPAAQLLAATVREEILFGLETLGLPEAEAEERLAEASERFGLRGLEERDPRSLSGGEQQKLILAAVTARRPAAIVLDEAFSMLDEPAAAAVAMHLERLRAAGMAVVAFEHRPGPLARLGGVARRALAGPPAAEAALPELPWRLPSFRLAVEHLGVRIGGRELLRGIDLSLRGGSVVAVVGANGAGKTTLLRALAGLQDHNGRVRAEGAAGGVRLGLCFQNPDRQLFNATVREEVLFRNQSADLRLYRGVMALLGLARYEDTPPLLLSEGEKKRLALAIVLLRPGLSGVCLDEPTLGQDEARRRALGVIVRRLAQAGYLCVVATHDLEWATEFCDEVVHLRDGRTAAPASRAGGREGGSPPSPRTEMEAADPRA
jgi:energy-coupling factor transport system ATP-binding protein